MNDYDKWLMTICRVCVGLTVAVALVAGSNAGMLIGAAICAYHCGRCDGWYR